KVNVQVSPSSLSSHDSATPGSISPWLLCVNPSKTLRMIDPDVESVAKAGSNVGGSAPRDKLSVAASCADTVVCANGATLNKNKLTNVSTRKNFFINVPPFNLYLIIYSIYESLTRGFVIFF